jgi:hypothetical protein
MRPGHSFSSHARVDAPRTRRTNSSHLCTVVGSCHCAAGDPRQRTALSAKAARICSSIGIGCGREIDGHGKARRRWTRSSAIAFPSLFIVNNLQIGSVRGSNLDRLGAAESNQYDTSIHQQRGQGRAVYRLQRTVPAAPLISTIPTGESRHWPTGYCLLPLACLVQTIRAALQSKSSASRAVDAPPVGAMLAFSRLGQCTLLLLRSKTDR